ncbi:SGNH/GDSL hydrolase family protein [Mucilaginibacter terrae]|uniref:SGNH/GDSL hydrolase family protein n=1 Tax=Mucilaginibacter terrae TaxID=1955052 RepID=UPI00289A02BD|nr:SGNH/GDSL hydrolase family protein [Mucilaginibacter terrae]
MKRICVAAVILLPFTVLYASAQSNYDKWKGFERVSVKVNNFNGYYVKPQHPLKGNPWVWRASFPDWHTDIDSILLTKGFHIAYLDADNLYGNALAMQAWDAFYRQLTAQLNLSAKPALEAVSRGALYALTWAKRNPDKVSCIYAETPVYDVKSWPGGKGKGIGDSAAWNEFKSIFKFTEQQALAYHDNPIDNLEGLAAFKVPVLNVVGLWDQITPLAENAALFVSRYNALGGPATVIPVTAGPQTMNGHHIPIPNVEQLANFIINNTAAIEPLPYSRYINVRSGIANFERSAVIKKKAVVAFLGGSITYNPGWRQKVCTYLQEFYPQTQFRFIAAGIPSLGSLPHAFRLQQDVLDSGKVDLLFLEAAVNDRVNGTDSLTQVRDLEGIVRHAKRANPNMDIVMMEFADPDKNHDYDGGKTPVEVTNHELVANSYGLASINLAKEVHDKIKNREFSWDDDFKDLHPSVFGQELYFANIKELFAICREKTAQATVVYKQLPSKLNKFSFANGSYYTIKNAKTDKNWSLNANWHPTDNTGTREGFVNIPVLSATTAGARLTLKFKGDAIGIAVLSGPDAGAINYSIDNGAYKRLSLYTPWSSSLHLPWYLLLGAGLSNTTHSLSIIIDDAKPEGSLGKACRIVNFLVNKP